MLDLISFTFQHSLALGPSQMPKPALKWITALPHNEQTFDAKPIWVSFCETTVRCCCFFATEYPITSLVLFHLCTFFVLFPRFWEILNLFEFKICEFEVFHVGFWKYGCKNHVVFISMGFESSDEVRWNPRVDLNKMWWREDSHWESSYNSKLILFPLEGGGSIPIYVPHALLSPRFRCVQRSLLTWPTIMWKHCFSNCEWDPLGGSGPNFRWVSQSLQWKYRWLKDQITNCFTN